jgi:hypothetical protein
MIGTVGGTALGAFILGLSYDLTGSYSDALNLLLTLPLLIAIASFLVKRPPARISKSLPTPVLNHVPKHEVHP